MSNTTIESLSNLIDIISKTFLLHAKRYVKYNLDLSKSSRENYEDTLIMTFDVVNLYTNILHIFGLEAVDFHPGSSHARFNKELVLECAKFILQNNNLKFNNEFYNQIKGTNNSGYNLHPNLRNFIDRIF